MEFPYVVKVVWGDVCVALHGCGSIDEASDCVIRETAGRVHAPIDAQVQVFHGASIIEYFEFNGKTWEVK